MEMFGYAWTVLYVDLTTKKFRDQPLKNGFCEKYIGGKGFAMRLLYDSTKPE